MCHYLFAKSISAALCRILLLLIPLRFFYGQVENPHKKQVGGHAHTASAKNLSVNVIFWSKVLFYFEVVCVWCPCLALFPVLSWLFLTSGLPVHRGRCDASPCFLENVRFTLVSPTAFMTQH